LMIVFAFIFKYQQIDFPVCLLPEKSGI